MARQVPTEKTESTDTIAILLEIVFGLFGIMGMGWLYAGSIPVAILLMLGYWAFLVLEVFVVGITAGFASCCFVPLNLTVVIISGFRVRDHVRRSGAQGSIMYVIVTAGIVILLACAVLTGLFLLGGLTAIWNS